MCFNKQTGSVEASSVIRGDNEQVLLQQNKELRQQYDSLKKDIPLMEEALKSSKVCALVNAYCTTNFV